MAATPITTRSHSGAPTAVRWLLHLGALLFVLAIPLVLIGTNVRYLFGAQWLYTLAVDRYEVAAVTGAPRDELIRATRELREYISGPDEYLSIQVTDVAGRTGPLFNPREVGHMRDVRLLVQGIFRVQEFSFLFVLAYVVLRAALERRAGLRSLAQLGWVSSFSFLLVGIAFGVTATLSFDWLFTRFHLLSFSNDLWQLDPRTDHLIQLFPFEFWQIATGLLVGLALIEIAVLALLSRIMLWRLETTRHVASGQGTEAASI